ncbi:sugar transferase [Rhizobium sp. PL01]|uniref:sugar transferase n=1 Tax=Rhizobium sp. PL01 TaxID=3085631 RepID=UPI00298299A3|nr:sugar transferase [Rhizobium sp. PL01]MDW5317945.1 sugar transferase [Rhizobium sp. PL01]
MTEKTLPQRTLPIRGTKIGNTRAHSSTLPGKQSATGITQFHLNPVRVPDLPVQLGIKRTVDATSALCGLLVLAPALVLIAALMKLDSKGPVFARQLHTGLNGAPFTLLTFRCRPIGLGDGYSAFQPETGVWHVTPLGRLLNSTNLGALPRLWNVLVGDLSLVGPRPHVPDLLAAGRSYSDLIQGYEYRNLMRPGLTGLAQTHGFRDPAETPRMAFRQLISDVDYIGQFSLLLDLKIMIRTAMNAVKRRPRP